MARRVKESCSCEACSKGFGTEWFLHTTSMQTAPMLGKKHLSEKMEQWNITSLVVVVQGGRAYLAIPISWATLIDRNSPFSRHQMLLSQIRICTHVMFRSTALGGPHLTSLSGSSTLCCHPNPPTSK
jgi:hypothetical protein